MRRFFWPILALTVLLIIFFLFAWLHKTITFIVDGQPQQVSTFALKVGGALRSAGITCSPDDKLEPAADAWLVEGDTIVLDRAAAIQIYADGSLYNLVSVSRLPKEILAQAGVPWHVGDGLLSNGLHLSPDELLPQVDSYSLQVVRPVTINLHIGDAIQTITATTNTLGQALWQADVKLYAADRIQLALSTPLTQTLDVTLETSRPVLIQLADGEVTFRSAAITVGEILAEAGLALQGLDYSQPGAEQSLPTNGHIRVVRVTEEVLVEQMLLPFETETTLVDDLELDQHKLVRAGEYGIQAERVRVRYEDEQEVSRVVESQWVARQPSSEIIGLGIKAVKHTLQTPDGTITYYRALQFWATPYSPKSQGGSFSTATGEILRKGIVAIDPDYVPYGTMMYVPGYGYAKAADTGRIVGRWIDLGYSDDDKESWSKWVTVYFLWPPPAYIPPVIPPPSHY